MAEPQQALPPIDAAWFAGLADGGELVFFSLRTRPDLCVLYVNDAVEGLLGLPADAVRADARILLDRIDGSDAERLDGLLHLRPGDSAVAGLHWSHRDGRPVGTRAYLRSRQDPDGATALEGVLQRWTALQEDQQVLDRSQERYRLLAENAWDVIWTMDLDGRVTYVSPAVERVRGITPAEAMNQTLDQIHPPESAARVVDYYQRLFAAIQDGGEPPLFRGEQEYYRKDGSIMVGELQVIPHVDASGRVVEILGVTRDISERKRFESELTRLAVTDPLTGAWNRRHGEELLAADLADAGAFGPPLSVLMLDIDHFKRVNDTFGHPAGDLVLVEFTDRLRSHLRTTDMLARWGGEEFLVLLRDCTLADAVEMAERLRCLTSGTPFRHIGRITVSIGAAESRPGDDLASWIGRADRALYEAKRSGRDTVCS